MRSYAILILITIIISGCSSNETIDFKKINALDEFNQNVMLPNYFPFEIDRIQSEVITTPHPSSNISKKELIIYYIGSKEKDKIILNISTGNLDIQNREGKEVKEDNGIIARITEMNDGTIMVVWYEEGLIYELLLLNDQLSDNVIINILNSLEYQT